MSAWWLGVSRETPEGGLPSWLSLLLTKPAIGKSVQMIDITVSAALVVWLLPSSKGSPEQPRLSLCCWECTGGETLCCVYITPCQAQAAPTKPSDLH